MAVVMASMRREIWVYIILASLVIIFLWQVIPTNQDPSPRIPLINNSEPVINEPVQPVPLPVNLDPNKVELGRRLFNETALSPDKNRSCASCHNLKMGGVNPADHIPGGEAHQDAEINTLTVFNSANNFAYYWDGRAASLDVLINEALTSPSELNTSWHVIIDRLSTEDDYAASFASSYKGGVLKGNVVDAMKTFLRSLVTPNARIDRFLRGDAAALDDEEKRGYQLFKSYGCVACHQGINVGGNMFQLFGVMEDYFADRDNISRADQGRFNVTGLEVDRHRFRVPTLRNIALTAPYFHNGSAETLEQAVMVMGVYQLGRDISQDDVGLIVKFLNTLTGEYNGKPL